MQKTYTAAEFTFKFVGDWYEYDRTAGEKLALKVRNAEAKRLAAEGYRVTKFSLGTQLMSKGGIGSGHPHIEILSKCYGLNARKEA